MSEPQTQPAPIEPTGTSCEVEVSPYPTRDGFEPPTEEQIRRDAGVNEEE